VLKINLETDDYTVTVGDKKYRCHTLRGCFKAVHGRWPEDSGEMDKFIEEIVKG
jgi:hypothetical protein